MRGLSLVWQRWRGKTAPPFTAPLPVPSRPLCILGDIHGRLDLLHRMQAQIATRAAGQPVQIVLVGDLVDRGPDSAGVLRAVHQMVQTGQGDVLCLMGNHERMMLDFLADPARCGPRWLRAGGADTLASFGLNPWAPARGKDTAAQMTDLAQALHAALPEGMLDWLQTLPLVWHTDGLSVVHAAADPACAVDAQSDKTLLWGHPDFLTRPRSDGIWIAHGHTIVPRAETTQGRIATDTGAYKTNRLSAAWIDKTGLSWLVV